MKTLRVSFQNPEQRKFYYCKARNQCFSGGYNNGKTYIACFKAICLCVTFPNYRLAICRLKYTDLKRTTMQTFFQIIDPDLVESHSFQEGVTRLKNGSVIYWMHLDAVDEASLKGLEVNTVLVDQAEEIDEAIYHTLDSRIGRWSGATVPQYLLDLYPNWPKKETGNYIVPSYHWLLVNPDTQFHFVYRLYHPDSLERRENFAFFSGQWDEKLGSTEAYQEALKRDPEWVEKFVKGNWGIASSAIHILPKECLIDYSPELIQEIKSKGNLFRSMDHGDSSPTCCLWFAALHGVYICYREYYVSGRPISFHRQAIFDLSEGEEYSGSYADPQIFKKTSQKDGGFWSVADEYRSTEIEGPALFWTTADNNEYATRNRINELLKSSSRYLHPITRERGSPGLYFIKSSPDYPYGCKESIKQLGSQRKIKIGNIDGKDVYSDERDEKVTDHAYDPLRYFVAMHGVQPRRAEKRPSRNTFAYYNMLKERANSMGEGVAI